MKKLLVDFISFYQTYLSFDKGILALFAPGGACKYSPTCSEYTKQMIKKYGALKGAKMGLIRIWSCR